MKKIIVIINGSGGVGKDTICDIVAKHYKTMNVSAIDPIKKIALENGWNGSKDEKSRKFLSELKRVFIEFNDLPTVHIIHQIEDFIRSNNEVMFIHIREPEEIAKLKSLIHLDYLITLLVTRGDSQKWNNKSDDNVENYRYDYYYNNDKSLDELEKDFLSFFDKIIKDIELS